MTSRWLQAQLTMVINLLTLNCRYQITFFSSVSSHLPVSELRKLLSWMIAVIFNHYLRSLQPTWRHKLADIFTSFTYQTNWNISGTNHKNKKLKNKLHYSLKSSFIPKNKKFYIICTLRIFSCPGPQHDRDHKLENGFQFAVLYWETILLISIAVLS
jgi:hypothetical protein